MVNSHSAPLDAVFAALADPTRRAIVERLTRSPEVPLAELAAPFRMSLPAVSKHVGVLERARVVQRVRRGRVRYCRLTAEPLGEATRWLDRYRRFWEHQFDRLAEYLESTTNAGDVPCSPSAPPTPATRSSSGEPSPRPRRPSSPRGRRPRR